MRRLSLLLFGLVATLAGLALIRNAADPAPYVLRDGLLIASIGALFFAANSARLWPAPARHPERRWPIGGRVLVATGFACALTGAALFVTPATLPLVSSLRLTLWLLGILLTALGALWRGAVIQYGQPSFRWDRQADGEFVRLPMDDDAPAATSAYTVRFITIALLALSALGAYLRLWNLMTAPAGCVGLECTRGLQLLEGHVFGLNDGLLNPQIGLARLLLPWLEDAILSLRLSTVVWSVATIPALFWAARRPAGPSAALLATLLLAISPWHISATRISEPWLIVPLLACLTLYFLTHALERRQRGDGLLAGLTLGLIATSAPPLLPAVALWALGACALLLLYKRSQRGSSAALFVCGLAVGALPALIFSFQNGSALALGGAADAQAKALLLALFAANSPALGADGPLTDMLFSALMLAGFATLIRWARRPRAALTVAGAAAFVAAIAVIDAAEATTLGRLTALLPFAYIAAGVAIQQLGRALVPTWRQLIRPQQIFAAAMVTLLLFTLPALQSMYQALESSTLAGQSSSETAMARLIAADNGASEEAITWLVPPSLLENPSLRLLASEQIEAGTILPMGSIAEILSRPVESTANYLIPADHYTILELLGLFFPAGVRQPMLDETGQELLFTLFQVRAGDNVQEKGLRGAYFRGFGVGELEPAFEVVDGPLRFDWSADPPLPPPFSVRWSGLLLFPEAGRYSFSVEGVDDPASVFSLRIDGEIILDTSLQLREHSRIFAEGVFQIDIDYFTGAVSEDFALRWERPGAEFEVIPRQALLANTIPNFGLLATYYNNADFQEPAALLRKEMDFGANLALGFPASVRWEGKLAANRAGEYMLGVLAEGQVQLLINDQLLVDSTIAGPATSGESATALLGYFESLLYLESGWHDIEVRFVPEGALSQLQLLWQPPGARAQPLSPRYLLPSQAKVYAADVMLPSAPQVLTPGADNDLFALSQGNESRTPQTVLPPADLPGLPLEDRWQVNNGCGAGDTQLNQPHGVAIDALRGRIYVADTANRRIAIFDFDGAVSAAIRDDRLEEPVDVAITPSGELLILDALTQSIYTANVDTGAIEALASDAQFYRPRGISVSRDGIIVVADTGGARVALLAPDGRLMTSYAGNDTLIGRNQPTDAIATPTGVWAVTSEDGRIWNLDLMAGVLAAKKAFSIDGPQIAEMEDAGFFVSDPRRGAFLFVLPSGQPVRQFTYPDVLTTPTGIGAGRVDDTLVIAVADADRCSLSVWHMAASGLDSQ